MPQLLTGEPLCGVVSGYCFLAPLTMFGTWERVTKQVVPALSFYLMVNDAPLSTMFMDTLKLEDIQLF